MSARAEPHQGDLRQRLEILRIRGARHRLELALSIETLASNTGGMRRGLGSLLSFVGMLSGGHGKGALRTVLRGLLPVVISMFAGSRAVRSVGRVRTALEVGALVLLIYRTIKRALGKSDPQPAEGERPASGTDGPTRTAAET